MAWEVCREEFCIELREQLLHSWCVEVLHNELLVLFKTVMALDFGDSAFFREEWIWREDELCLC